MLVAGEVVGSRGPAGQQAGDVGDVHHLHVLEGRLVDGAGSRGGIVLFLGRDHRALQRKVVQLQRDLVRWNILADCYDFGIGLISEARDRNRRTHRAHAADRKMSVAVGDGPLLGRFYDDGRKLHGAAGGLVCHSALDGICLRQQLRREQQAEQDSKILQRRGHFIPVLTLQVKYFLKK